MDDITRNRLCGFVRENMTNNMDETRKEYRQGLLALEQKAQEQYDRTVVYLSAGALGVSFAFVQNFIDEAGAGSSFYLMAAWILWAVSVSASLASLYTSTRALRRTVEALDAGKERPDRTWHDSATGLLNPASGIFFFVGVIMMAVFVFQNL